MGSVKEKVVEGKESAAEKVTLLKEATVEKVNSVKELRLADFQFFLKTPNLRTNQTNHLQVTLLKEATVEKVNSVKENVGNSVTLESEAPVSDSDSCQSW